MLDSLSFLTPVLQPESTPRPAATASMANDLTNPSSITGQSASAPVTGVGPARTSTSACVDSHAAVKSSRDEIMPRSTPARADLRDAATKFGSTAASPHHGVSPKSPSTGAAGLEGGDARGHSTRLAQAQDFAKGVGEGVWDGASGMADGVGHLAKGAYHLATSADARAQAVDTVSKGATAARHFAQTAVTDPSKAAAQVGHAAGAAWNGVSTAYQQAQASGHGAEFIGKAVGQAAVIAATLPAGGAEAEGASVLGDVGRVAQAAAKAGEAGESVGDTAMGIRASETMSSSAVTDAGAAATSTVAKSESKTDATSKALMSGHTRSAGQPPIDIQHVFTGEIGPKRGGDGAKGFHHAPNDGLHPGAQVEQELKPRNAQGVYSAKVEISKAASSSVHVKQSTMFPNDMSRDDVVASIQHAYHNATDVSGPSFIGPSGHGFEIRGFTSGTGSDFHIRTAYPLYKQ